MAVNPKKKDNLIILSELVNRAVLASKLGLSYSGDRDIYQALGYEKTLKFEDYYAQYRRQDIASAIIDRPVSATWRGGFEIVESSRSEDTGFEQAWKALNRKFRFRLVFKRLDRLAMLGRYGVLVLGFDDVKQTSDFAMPVIAGKRNLLYVKPFSEGSVSILKYVENTNDPRYGLPEIYEITLSSPEQKTTSVVQVHYTRVLHVTGKLLDDETEGIPALENVFNRLKDLEKIVGGSGEMFWRGARPGYQGKVDSEYQLTKEVEDKLLDIINEYEHNLRRLLVMEGIDWRALETQIADPTAHVDVQVQMIAAATGIPKRILTGSERGELASLEDRKNWFDLIRERREEYAEEQIVRPFIDMMIEYGVLPQPKSGDYSVKWPDLYAVSEKDRAEIGRIRATAIREYLTNLGADRIMPIEAFLKYGLSLSDDDIELVQLLREVESKRGDREQIGGPNTPSQGDNPMEGK